MKFIKILIFSILITSCQSTEHNSSSDETLKVVITEDTVSFNKNEQILKVMNTYSHWRIEFEYNGEQKEWCKVTSQSGNIAKIECNENISTDERKLTIIIKNGEQIAKTKIVQLGTPTSDKVYNWMELPRISLKGDELFISHHITLDNKLQRSYSMLFDKEKRIAHWVAYPLNKVLLADNTDRGNTWRDDPKIPKIDQISATFSGYNPELHRGHQIPSADRVCSEQANEQTFFYSNITPQRAIFNQGVWLKLETMVRNYAYNCDTLYVVTGAVLQTSGGKEKVEDVTDKNGIRAAVPNYYYKVLLRLKGTTYDAIGFWFDHKKEYTNNNPTKTEVKSVDDIERLTGYDFFKSLPQSTQNRIESEFNPNKWGIVP